MFSQLLGELLCVSHPCNINKGALSEPWFNKLCFLSLPLTQLIVHQSDRNVSQKKKVLVLLDRENIVKGTNK